jgi:hypothetical protein
MRGRQLGSSAINDRHMAVYGSRPDPGPGGATKLQGWSFAFSFGKPVISYERGAPRS